jgi:hypothetical protein
MTPNGYRSPRTRTCRIERSGPVLVSFFGALQLGSAQEPGRSADIGSNAASLLDIAGTKAAVIQKRAETKDYLDIAALPQNGMDPPTLLAAARIIYGETF